MPLPDKIRTRLREYIAAKLGSKDFQAAGDLRRTFVKVVNEDLKDYLPRIKSPVLLVWGENDRETPLKDGQLMKELIPDSRLEVIPGGGHFSYMDDQPIFNSILESFLNNGR